MSSVYRRTTESHFILSTEIFALYSFFFGGSISISKCHLQVC